MKEKELAALAEEARRRLLAQPRETVWQSVEKEPLGSLLLVLLLYIGLGFPLAFVSFFVNLSLGFELWEVPGFGFIYPFLPPATYAAYLVRDNEKKYRAEQKGFRNALPTSIAKAYCSRFDSRDDLWPAMDYLWREGQARAFGAINSIVIESIERSSRDENEPHVRNSEQEDPGPVPF
jgi:hypothetical protein